MLYGAYHTLCNPHIPPSPRPPNIPPTNPPQTKINNLIVSVIDRGRRPPSAELSPPPPLTPTTRSSAAGALAARRYVRFRRYVIPSGSHVAPSREPAGGHVAEPGGAAARGGRAGRCWGGRAPGAGRGAAAPSSRVLGWWQRRSMRGRPGWKRTCSCLSALGFHHSVRGRKPEAAKARRSISGWQTWWLSSGNVAVDHCALRQPTRYSVVFMNRFN